MADPRQLDASIKLDKRKDVKDSVGKPPHHVYTKTTNPMKIYKQISPKRFRPVFPLGFQKDLKKLDLSGYGLTALVLPEDQEPGEIEELNLSNNPLTPSNLYLITRMDSLKKLDLSGCGLTEFPPLFKCEKIEDLNLSNNPLAQSDLHLITRMDSLKKLDLSGCGLTEFSPLFKCEKIEDLNLSNNPLTHSDPYLITRMDSLKKLDLSGCGLTEFYPLFGCDKIEELNLSNNPLAHLYPLTHIVCLKKLDLSGCGLTELLPFFECEKIEELNLSNNPLAHLYPLTHMDSLKKLDLSGCGLTGFYPWFKSEKIEELNISNNPLTPPVSSFFRGMDNLKKLDLSGCGHKELPYDPKICVNLQELNLSNNFFGHQDLLERLNTGNSMERCLHQSAKESLEATNLTRIIFADASYTHINGVWTVEAHEGVASSKKTVRGLNWYSELDKWPRKNIWWDEFRRIRESQKLTIETYHSMVRSLKIVCNLVIMKNYSGQKSTLDECCLEILHGLNRTTCSSGIPVLEYVQQSIWYLKSAVSRLRDCCIEDDGDKNKLDESETECELAFSKANEAFSDKLSVTDKILVAKLKIMSQIVLNLTTPEPAVTGSLQSLQELHDLQIVRTVFSSPRLSSDFYRSVIEINKILFEFVRPLSESPLTVEEWPATIQLQDEGTCNPLNELFHDTWRRNPKAFRSQVQNLATDVAGYSFTITECCGKTPDNSITVDRKGGCFSLPEVCAFLLFPPNTVDEKVTLECRRVRPKECEVELSDGEAFVSQILEIGPQGVTFRRPVTVLLSHSLDEDQDFRNFYELIVENLSPTGCQVLKSDPISSIKDISKEISNREILEDYLPLAKTTIQETCTLAATTRAKLSQILIPTNRRYVFSKHYGDVTELKITFPSGVTEEILSLKVQLFPVNAANKKIRSNRSLVCAPVVRVSGQTASFLKPVDVELTYSHSDVVNIEEEFLPVGKTIKLTTEYGFLLHEHNKPESTPEWQVLNGSNDVSIERLRKDQIKFSFSVNHFSDFDIQPIVQTSNASITPEYFIESPEETSEDESEDTDWSEGSEQMADNSITFNQAGGCFSLPEVGAILFVPSQAVEEQVTLTYKEVNCEKRGLMPRDGELFVSGIFKIEPEGVTFKKSVTVLISHSVHEDDNFRDFHELVVENLNQTGWQELETERISSSEEIPEEVRNLEMLNDYLPLAKAIIDVTCTLVVATRVKLCHISIPPNEDYTFYEQYGKNAELKITFPAGATDEMLKLQVQLFPADAVLNEDVHSDESLVCAPVIKVTGQTTPFLKEVNVELMYSNNDVADIEEEYLPVGNKFEFSDEYGMLLRSQKSKTECERLIQSNTYIERPRNDQLKFSFSVKHFCKYILILKKKGKHRQKRNQNLVVKSSPSPNISFDAVALAIHDPKKETLYTFLAGFDKKVRLEKKWNFEPSSIGRKIKVGQSIFFGVPLKTKEEKDNNRMKLKADEFSFNQKTIPKLVNRTSEGDCERWDYMYFLSKRFTGENHVFEKDGFHNTEIHDCVENPQKENSQPANETSPIAMSARPGNNVPSEQEDARKSSNDEISQVILRRCELFEKTVESIAERKLEIKTASVEDTKGGIVTKVLDVGGPTLTAICGLVGGLSIALSISMAGIPSLVAAFVGGAVVVTKIADKRVTQGKAKAFKNVLNATIEEAKPKMSLYLNCVVKDVAKELSYIFEYQLLQLKNDEQVEILAKCAVDLMLHLEKDDTFDRNTLLRKVLKDGKMSKKPILTSVKDRKWSAPNVFRKPGLRRIISRKNRAQLKHFVKPNGACNTWKYGYRGQFVVWKEYDSQNNGGETSPMVETPPTDETSPTESNNEDDCAVFCEECSSMKMNDNTLSGHYFSDSEIDKEYTIDSQETSIYRPMHILVRCPKVLNCLKQLPERRPSLAGFLKKKLGLPEDDLVHPVYRPHSRAKVSHLQNSDLTGSDFSHSDFTDSCLENCDLTKCKMLFANLARANFSGSLFCGTFISHSNLINVEAPYCELTQTSLLHSAVDGAHVEWPEPSLSGNCYDGSNMPDVMTTKKRQFNLEKQERTSESNNSASLIGAGKSAGDGKESSPILSNLEWAGLGTMLPSTSGSCSPVNETDIGIGNTREPTSRGKTYV